MRRLSLAPRPISGMGNLHCAIKDYAHRTPRGHMTAKLHLSVRRDRPPILLTLQCKDSIWIPSLSIPGDRIKPNIQRTINT